MTKTLFATSCALAAGLVVSALAGPAHAASACVEVRLSNVAPGRGSVMLAVWGGSDSFFKTPLASKRVPASDANIVVSLCGLEAKEIAVTVYQDLNDNGKLDTNLLGIPNEPTGASGKPSRYGPPTWDTTRVLLRDGVALEIRL
jgi:uncharacterized protein (DUF2141 family)